jgi:hypothetical protein
MSLTNQAILGYATALGIGLLIGTERERHKGTGPTRSSMGIRMEIKRSNISIMSWQ